jgi:hypothetical protein
LAAEAFSVFMGTNVARLWEQHKHCL